MNRVAAGDTVFHILNRSTGRVPVFHTDKDYAHFESASPRQGLGQAVGEISVSNGDTVK